jgi:hypothetical protein
MVHLYYLHLYGPGIESRWGRDFPRPPPRPPFRPTPRPYPPSVLLYECILSLSLSLSLPGKTTAGQCALNAHHNLAPSLKKE